MKDFNFNPKDSTKLSVVIPVYNEQKSIRGIIKEIQDVLNTINVKFEIIVVNDASIDNTGYEISKCSEISIITNPINLGYGASIKKGINIAKYNLICITDADGTYPVKEIPNLLSWANETDMVIGARTGKISKVPLMRRPVKWFLNRFASYISASNIPDLNSGLRIFKKELINKYLYLLPDGFSLTSTITIAAVINGHKVRYEPINYNKRAGKSSIHPVKDTLRFLNLIVSLAVLFKPLNIFTPVSVVIFLAGFTKACFTFITQNRIGVGESMIIIMSIILFLIGHVANMIILLRKDDDMKLSDGNSDKVERV